MRSVPSCTHFLKNIFYCKLLPSTSVLSCTGCSLPLSLVSCPLTGSASQLPTHPQTGAEFSLMMESRANNTTVLAAFPLQISLMTAPVLHGTSPTPSCSHWGHRAWNSADAESQGLVQEGCRKDDSGIRPTEHLTKRPAQSFEQVFLSATLCKAHYYY